MCVPVSAVTDHLDKCAKFIIDSMYHGNEGHLHAGGYSDVVEREAHYMYIEVYPYQRS